MAVLLPTQNIPLPFNDGLSVTTHKIFPDSQIALATPLSFNKSHMFVKQSSCRFSLGRFNTLIIKYARSQNQPKPPKANQNYPKSPTANQNHPQQPKLPKTNKRHPLSKLTLNQKHQ